jgi:hypothetical protein
MMREVHEGRCAFREHHDVIEQQGTINVRYAEGHFRMPMAQLSFVRNPPSVWGRMLGIVVSGFVISG